MDVTERAPDLDAPAARRRERRPLRQRGPLNRLRPRLLWALAIVVAVSVLSIMVVGLERRGRESADFAVDSPATSGASSPGGPARAVLWVSDGFGGVTSSTGRAAPATTYPQMVCRSLAWTCTVDAQGGSGYVASAPAAGSGSGSDEKTPAARPLQARLSATKVVAAASVVVVDAGRFDATVAAAPFETAANRYLVAVRKAYPKARIALVVPSSPAASRPEYRRIGAVLREVAAAQGAVVVDPAGAGALADVRRNKTLVTSRGDLTAAGQAYYAQVLVRLLLSTGAAEAPDGPPRPSTSREA